MNADLKPGRQVVLIVDDSPDTLALIGGLLQPEYQIKVATSGEQALLVAVTDPPDLILLDVTMPGMGGHQTCRRLKANVRTAAIPVIFLTARCDAQHELLGFELGAADYIVKPFSPVILLARVRAQLALKAMSDLLRDQNVHLEHEVAHRLIEIEAERDATLLALASLAERDVEACDHGRRAQHYVRALAERLRLAPRFASRLSDDYIARLSKAVPLHDLGKAGIPDAILLKPGRLTEEEFASVRAHTTRGYEALEQAERALELPGEFFGLAKEVVLSHHEKWDGSGYPQGLVAEAIPLGARLMALADVYDALTSRRIYKERTPHEAAVDIIVGGRGVHFDPDILDAFVDIQDEFLDIALRFPDGTTAAGVRVR
ncbi:response regulator [Chitinolyticbacter albus]|uniref:response regulator n=1 Tax=Chitinolyticbacter albus TaxID=2961951 RepID=UPI00210DDAAB|nr:HD domain-containing phosphohydrolase [Chitinolyticbacter albus]